MLRFQAYTFAADGTVSRECVRSASGGMAHVANFADSKHQPLNSVGHHLLPILYLCSCFSAAANSQETITPTPAIYLLSE